MKAATITALALGLALAPARAGVNESISANVRTTNYTGYVVAADAVSGHVPDRSFIRGEFTMDFTWDTLNNTGANYEAAFSLEDETGAQVPLAAGAGPSVTEITEVYQVSLDAQTTADSHAFSAQLRPAAHLVPQKRYTVKARWRKQPGGGSYGGYTSVPLHTTAQLGLTADYFHFTNTASDAGANASVKAALNTWQRPWMIANSTTQGSIQLRVDLTVRRFDEIDDAPASLAILTNLALSLRRVSTGSLVWTAPDKQVTISTPSHAGGTGPTAEPASASGLTQFDLEVPDGVLVPGELYEPVIAVTHSGEQGGSGLNDDGTAVLDAHRLLRLSGKVFFGTLEALFDEVTNDPVSDGDWNYTPLPYTTLAIPVNHGFISGVPGPRFGGTPLAVDIQADGDAVYSDGTQISVSAAGGTQTVNGTQFRLYQTYLNMSGAHAQVFLIFPQGSGIMNSDGTMSGEQLFADTPLSNTLVPGTVTVTATADIFCERAPLYFRTGSLSFNPATGTITTGAGQWKSPFYNDKAYLTAGYIAGSFENPLDAVRPSNTEHFLAAHNQNEAAGITISADSAGRSQLTANANFAANGAAFAPHYPQITSATTPGSYPLVTGGHITFDHNAVVSGSQLTLSEPTRMYYPRDTVTGACGTSAGFGFVDMQMNFALKFTVDGGLAGVTNILDVNGDPNRVQWGAVGDATFAHQLPYFGTGWFMMPGFYLPGGEGMGVAMEQSPAALLFSGVSKPGLANLNFTERPDEDGYSVGEANYAGINLRVSEGQLETTGVSRLAGQPLNYELSTSSKYVVGVAGVTGITDAVSNSFSPNPMSLYPGSSGPGTQLDLTAFKLSFLDNLNRDSLTEGELFVGGPSNFGLKIDNLKLGPKGELSTCDIDPTELGSTKTLQYWQVPFTPKAVSFMQKKPATGCASVGDGFLTVCMEAHLPLLHNEVVQGVLGFGPDGDLITKSDAVAEGTGIDSRFQLPNNLNIHGPDGDYTLQPVVRAALNRWGGFANVSDRPPTGFLSLAGRLDVPFFESMKVHIHANNAPTSNVFIMGGWDHDDAQGSDGRGWVDSNHDSFFSKPDFDAENYGFPFGVVSLANYRSPPAPNPNNPNDSSWRNFRPRIFKNWFGVVKFDYPVAWDQTKQTFKSPISTKDDLLIFKLQHQVKRMTAKSADLSFDASMSVDVPIGDFNLAGISTDFDFAGELGGLIGGSGPAFDFGAVTGAMDGFDSLVRDSITQVLTSPLAGTTLTPLVDSLYNSMITRYNNAGGVVSTDVIAAMQGDLASVQSQAQSTIAGLAGTNTTGVIAKTRTVLSAAHTQLDKVQTAFSGAQLATGLASVLSNYAGSASNPEDTTLSDASATLGTAAETIGQINAKIADVEAALGSSSGALFAGLQSVAGSQSAEINTLASNVLNDAGSLLIGLNAPDGQLLTLYPEAELKQKIQQLVIDRITASAISSEYQRIFKEQIGDLRADALKQLDQIFAGLGGAIEERMKFNGAATPPPTPALGPLSSAMSATTVRGFARINGDSLEEMRLDANVNLDIASAVSGNKPGGGGMNMQAYVIAKALHSDSPEALCALGPGVDGLEVTVGADNVPLNWAGASNAKGFAQVKVAFADDGLPQSFDGALGMNGSFTTSGLQVIDPKIVLGAGTNQVYAGFALRAAFNGKEVAAQALLGRICNTAPLALVNPTAGNQLTTVMSDPAAQAVHAGAPYTGASVYVEGWMPLNELIGIPTTCMLNLRAGAGLGLTCFVPTNTLTQETIPAVGLGTQQMLGLSGQVLCVVTVKGTMTMNGAAFLDFNNLGATKMHLDGNGTVSGTIGVSPLSKTISKGIGVSGTLDLDTGDADVDVDF